MNWILQLVQNERDRQRAIEGFTDEHDDDHFAGQMARAAACYSLPPQLRVGNFGSLIFQLWPWDWIWWKPTPDNRQRELIKAMALLMAEIERLNRKQAVKTYEPKH